MPGAMVHESVEEALVDDCIEDGSHKAQPRPSPFARSFGMPRRRGNALSHSSDCAAAQLEVSQGAAGNEGCSQTIPLSRQQSQEKAQFTDECDDSDCDSVTPITDAALRKSEHLLEQLLGLGLDDEQDPFTRISRKRDKLVCDDEDDCSTASSQTFSRSASTDSLADSCAVSASSFKDTDSIPASRRGCFQSYIIEEPQCRKAAPPSNDETEASLPASVSRALLPSPAIEESPYQEEVTLGSDEIIETPASLLASSSRALLERIDCSMTQVSSASELAGSHATPVTLAPMMRAATNLTCYTTNVLVSKNVEPVLKM